jgi:hypothetical protein
MPTPTFNAALPQQQDQRQHQTLLNPRRRKLSETLQQNGPMSSSAEPKNGIASAAPAGFTLNVSSSNLGQSGTSGAQTDGGKRGREGMEDAEMADLEKGMSSLRFVPTSVTLRRQRTINTP